MAIPKAQLSRRRYGAGKLWMAPMGTFTEAWTPTGAAHKFTQGTTSGQVPGTTAALPLGITQEGMELEFGIDTEPDESAEYYYPHKTLVTGESATMSTTLKTLNATNLRLALNAAASAVSATPSATQAARVRRPNPGQEVNAQILWESLDDSIAIVMYQVLNTGAFTLAGRKGAEGVNISLELTSDLPDAAVSEVPVDIWVIGSSWAETVATD